MVEPEPDKIVGLPIKTGILFTNESDYFGKIRVLHDSWEEELAQGPPLRNLQPMRVLSLRRTCTKG